jgi:hypothetical protein
MATVIITVSFEEFGELAVWGANQRPVGSQTFRTVCNLQAGAVSQYDRNQIGQYSIGRPSPSVPQFSGTVAPIREVAVSLRRANRGIMETVKTDGAGYFEFKNWYAVYSDYEFVIHGDDLYQMKVYPVSAPIAHRWNGAPDRYDSTSFV